MGQPHIFSITHGPTTSVVFSHEIIEPNSSPGPRWRRLWAWGIGAASAFSEMARQSNEKAKTEKILHNTQCEIISLDMAYNNKVQLWLSAGGLKERRSDAVKEWGNFYSE